MCRLEILLTFLVTMAATVECRSILHKTDGETNLSRLRSHRPLQHKHNIRGIRLQRPSINKSTVSKTNFPSSEVLNPSWRRSILPQHNRVMGTHYPAKGTFQSQREARYRNTIRNNIVRHHTQPDLRRLSRFRQRIPHFDVRRYNSLLTSPLDKNLLSESDSHKLSDFSGYRPTYINTKQNENVNSGELTKRTPRRKLRINLNLNTKRDNNRQVISVKANNIRNIRLSHSSSNSIIDLHKGGHRARITVSKMLLHRPVNEETANTTGKAAPLKTKAEKMTQLSKQLPIDQNILKTENINRITQSSALSSSAALSTTATAITPGKYENTPVPSLIADKQKTSNDTSFNKSQNVFRTPSEIRGTNYTATEKNNSSTPTSIPVMNDNSVLTTTAQTNDVTTEEPDGADTPDVDILGLTDTSFRNKFFSFIDFD